MFGQQMSNTSCELDAASGGYPSPHSGWPDLDRAVGEFASHWGSTMNVMAQDLSELAAKVTAAGEAYDSVDSDIQHRAGGGGGGW